MQKSLTLSLLMALMAAACSDKPGPTMDYHTIISARLDSLQAFVANDLLQAAQHGGDRQCVKTFFAARQKYKALEHIVEYYAPTTARFINGPPLDELEVEEHRAFEPEGFQVVEELLFEYHPGQHDELIRHVRLLSVNLNRVKTLWENTLPTATQLMDAARLQVFRIISLGISGFDSPLYHQSIEELAPSLKAIEHMLKIISPNPEQRSEIEKKFRPVYDFIKVEPGFEKFNRALFIRKYANPLGRYIGQLQTEWGIPPVNENRMLHTNAVTLFDEGAFNFNLFSAFPNEPLTPAMVDLGRMLFFEKRLSKDGNRSCASCHQPQKAFTDGLPKSISLDGRSVLRNTPTLLNAALQNFQFYDMRSATLEAQAKDVVENKDEMHGSLAAAPNQFLSLPEYQAAFKTAFEMNAITEAKLQMAIAGYVRTLTSLNSPFDRYMRGDSSQLNDEQIEGFNLFMGKGQCGICHFLPLFNGTVPPAFTKTESEVLGVPAAPVWRHAPIDPDPGRYAIFEMPQLQHSFKTPTVRNAALTAPYMHNGVYLTLNEVLQFYNVGGGAGLGIELQNQTLSTDSLHLNDAEQQKIISFIHALTDTSAIVLDRNPEQ